MATELRDRLSGITAALLDPLGTYGSWRDAAVALFDLCSAVAPLAPNEAPSPDHHETMLPVGKAISAVDAARCILDFERTRCFLMSVDRVVEAVVGSGRRAGVLYAGTGPYAPLVVPLTARFGPDEVGFTLLDIHPSSVDHLHAVVAALGIEQYVDAIHLADATTFVVPEPDLVDVLIVETMQRALTREPQVAIAGNLLRQLPSSVTLVPERVTVSASLSMPGTSTDGRPLGDILIMDATAARRASGTTLHCGSLRLDTPPAPGEVLTLNTTLRVGDGVEIGPHASGLTMPYHLWNLPIERPGSVIDLSYRLGQDPDFVASVR